MKNCRKKIQTLVLSTIIIFGFIFILPVTNESILTIFSGIFHVLIKPRWFLFVRYVGIGIVLISLICLLIIIRYKELFSIKRIKNDTQKKIKEALASFVDYRKPIAEPIGFRLINLKDFYAIICFFIIALLFFINPCKKESAFILLTGDTAVYSSVAAAFDHPDLFKNDVLFKEKDIYIMHSTLSVQLIRLINWFTNNYGSSVNILFLITIFIQLSGFYLLGRIIYGSRFWAFILSLACAIPISLGQEIWGIWLPVPRILFQSILPFILCLFFLLKGKPRFWPYLMTIIGLSVYIHNFSALIWGFCIWVGLWLIDSRKLSRWSKLLEMICLGILFLIVLFPFINLYTFGQQRAFDLEDNKLFMYVIRNFFPNNIYNIHEVLLNFIQISFRNGVIIIGVCAYLFLFSLNNHKANEKINVIIVWITGILVISIFIPSIERLFEYIFQTMPFEVVLTRGIRYIYPLLLLLIFWGFSEFNHRIINNSLSISVKIFGFLFLLFLISKQMGLLNYQIQKLSSYFYNDKSICLGNKDKFAAYDFIDRNIPYGSSFLALTKKGVETSEFYELRYGLLRTLVFNYKDSGEFAYRDIRKLRKWYNDYWILKKIYEQNNKPCDWLIKILEVKEYLKAEYLLIESFEDLLICCLENSKLVYSNNSIYIFN